MMDSSAVRVSDAVDAGMLAGALDMERGLLAELGGILRRQREGVAIDDIDVVDASVFAANRVIHTLGEARRRRRAILGILGGNADTPLEELEQALGPEMTPEVIVARERLWTEAAGVAREIEVNRRVLRHVMQDRQRLVRALYEPPICSYDPQLELGGHGALVNRQV
jgi:hypothetical protein